MLLLLVPLSDPINVTIEGRNLTMTRFHSTEMMSTYLLAFVVCELGFISSAPGAPVLVTEDN